MRPFSPRRHPCGSAVPPRGGSRSVATPLVDCALWIPDTERLPLRWFRGQTWHDEWTWMMFNLALGMSAALVPKFYAGEDRIVLSKPLQP
jgi:hypothetical protein